MAVALDPFQRIVNVRWGGKPIFVVVTMKGQVYRAKLEDTELQSVALPIAGIMSIVGCDHGNPSDGVGAFVIAGSNINPPIGSAGFICTSADGSSWTESFKTPQGVEMPVGVPWSGTVSAIVYSPGSNMFAASCIVIKFGKPHREEIYTSSNGTAWGFASGIDVVAEEQYTHASMFPASYCAHNVKCKDDLLHNAPGGIMHSEENGVRMFPVNPPAVYYWNNSIPDNIDYHTLPLRTFGGYTEPIGSQPSSSITIQQPDPDDEETIISSIVAIPDLAIVTCVAGNGNTWLVGGFTDTSEESPGAVMITRDGGDTWKSFGDTPSGVVGIAVGEEKDAGL